MPEVQALYEAWQAQGVAVWAVGTGSEGRLSHLRDEKGLSLPIAVADDPWREALQVEAFPETLFIDAQGRVAERLQGGQDFAYFNARVEALLAEAAGEATAGSAPDAPAEAASGRHGFIAKLAYFVLHGPKKKERD